MDALVRSVGSDPPVPVLRPLVLFALVAAAIPAVAQPAPEALVGAWRARQLGAMRGVLRVETDETQSRRLDGPRGTVRIETRGTLALGRHPQRTVTSARVDGHDVEPERLEALEARLGRAFGHGFSDASHGPSLVPTPLARGTAPRGVADDVDGRPAWRVSLTFEPHRDRSTRDGSRGGSHRGPPRGDRPPGDRPPGDRPPGDRPPRDGPPDDRPHGPDRAEAWFTRSADAPRLLRIVTSGGRPGGGTLRRSVDFTPVGGLDVPERATADVRVTQRRRLRGYTTSISVEARYSGATVVRR